jgi:hypothetical protein
MKFNPTSRRFFLQGLGGSILGLPFLESLVPLNYAHAASPSANRRFIVLCQANGTYRPDWYPPTDNINRMVNVGNTHRQMNLTDVTGPVANSVSHLIGPEYASLRKKMLLLQNLNWLAPNQRGHQMATVLTGTIGRGNPQLWGSTVDPKYLMSSIDQVMANSSKVYSSEPIIRALHLRTDLNDAEPEIDLSWDYRNGKLEFPTRFAQPLTAFNSVFKTTSAPPVGNKENLLVDQVLEQYKALKGNRRATASDKAILDDHMSMVAQLQTAVQNVPGGGAQCSTTAPTKTYGRYTVADRGPMIDAYIQLIAAAIKCGATKVATLTLARGVDDLNWDSVLGTTMRAGWHGVGHSNEGEASSDMRKIHQFHMQKAASLMTALDVAEPGTNGTYLDNSIVYVGNEQSDHVGHSYMNRPILIGGHGGGVLQTNKYIDFSRSSQQSANYNRLLVTFLQAMGLTQDDYWAGELKSRGVAAGYGDDRGGNADRSLPLPGVVV